MLAFPLRSAFPSASRLVLGCMGLGGAWNADPVGAAERRQAEAVVESALAAGITVFDHADIYTLGKAEQVFGEILQARPSLRDQIVLQSKCGIRFEEGGAPKRYDLSAAYIERSVDGILQRLRTDRLDLLLLHRPDPLLEPQEVAEAFARLHRSGKVRGFGVSNMQAGQIAWLQRHLSQPLLVNQLEMSLLQRQWLEAGTTFNDPQQPPGTGGWAGLLEHCQQEGVQLQAWGALAKGQWQAHAVAPQLHAMAERLGLAPEGLLVAWLLRHPANIQPVIGSTAPARIAACAQGATVPLSRDDWYSLYVAARGHDLP